MSGIFLEDTELFLARTALVGEQCHPVLEKMRNHGTERMFPMVGPEVGRFFFQLAAIKQPKRILEFGSGFGYSAMWWALGCPTAEIHLTDYKQENLDEAVAFAKEAGLEKQFVLHQGNAIESTRGLKGPWDLIFCDLDKEYYPSALDYANEEMAPGGLLVFDNMLWGGRVAKPESEWGIQAKAIGKVTRSLYEDKRWMTSLLPIRDGVLLALRLS